MNKKQEEQLYQIAFTQVKGIGNITGRTLIEHLGSPKEIFKEKSSFLQQIPGITERITNELKNKNYLLKAEKEILFTEKNKIELLFFQDKNYPFYLRECHDAPLLLYYRGNASLNRKHIISIVGTRNATEYGKESCQKLIQEISKKLPDTLICSGLAYGIDICAHRQALKNNLETVGVLGHGLDHLYPSTHRETAIEMIKQGGLLTEFISGKGPDRPNFIMRNRIIAGMSSCTIVIESAYKGGSLVTANIANTYGRDVFAFPGRSKDTYSKGCNKIIKSNEAALIESGEDLIKALMWEEDCVDQKKQPKQQQLFVNLSQNEEKIMTYLSNSEKVHINTLVIKTGLPMTILSPLLFEMEMKGIIKVLPGCMYCRN